MSDLPRDPAETPPGPHDAHEDDDGLGLFRGCLVAVELLALFLVAVVLALWAFRRLAA